MANLDAHLTKRSCGETANLVCYGTAGNPLWTMPPEFDCGEWSLPIPDAGTVLVLAKHIKPRTNSSVTYTDIARTINGGADPTSAEKAASLLGACGSGGGMQGVTVNAKDPAYNTPGYIASKAKPQDIIIKLVRAASS
ncbi:hypothetical protein BCR34DRAFT_655133 [Clohesyomyces aquaticus]|uniref:Uncharacterized protein n=1 Tax=Clohesyomyces aquaticus TaxID=1231657 RepID=A0A1Y1ZJJ0_9PLEO|nr:hypothetical protein BCR34DRAFT_655133 [Clohesyomyces aquaticus]